MILRRNNSSPVTWRMIRIFNFDIATGAELQIAFYGISFTSFNFSANVNNFLFYTFLQKNKHETKDYIQAGTSPWNFHTEI